ncbi:MAG: hypothetical protein NTX03_04825 [Bacteroidetes bacterium]|nr:hypothetical protein [Bacteroidota bacterium]
MTNKEFFSSNWQKETKRTLVAVKALPTEMNTLDYKQGKMMDMYWTLMFDTIHHRGQLSTYYRSMGVRNPSIYGPSAEDIEDRIAAAQAASN